MSGVADAVKTVRPTAPIGRLRGQVAGVEDSQWHQGIHSITSRGTQLHRVAPQPLSSGDGTTESQRIPP